MIILGISCMYHDSGVAIIQDGEIIAAVQEERFTRKKHDSGIPVNAVKYCLQRMNISIDDVDYIVYYDNPLLTMNRFLKNALAVPENSDYLKNGFNKVLERINIRRNLEETIGISKTQKFLVTKHHISHAASAFYPSPYNDAVIITIDGVGEWATTVISLGKNNQIRMCEEIDYPHSIGLLYSAFTYFCGFKVNSGDYKFMGLAPYGTPKYYEIIKEKIIVFKEDGSFRLNMDYFDYHNGRTMVNEDMMSSLFDGGRRIPESRITKREMDIAASVQKVVEEIIIRISRYAKHKYGDGIDNLCIAGGVGLNCVANGKLQREGIFKNIWIQPASGDAGGALGAALFCYYDYLRNDRKVEIKYSQKGSYLGPEYDTNAIIEYLEKNGYPYHVLQTGERADIIAEELVNKKILGLFQGRMEFGPRALGNRSIIADCRDPEMQSKINLKIKYRESFRPFAPIVLEEKAKEYFDMDCDSPYMLKVGLVKEEIRNEFNLRKMLIAEDYDMLRIVDKPRSSIPAVTHVDYSARIQTVNARINKKLYDILKTYYEKTGCAVLVNTSFNVRGEPIVCSPIDAYECFMRTEMDVLVLENIMLYKEEQPLFKEHQDWRKIYALD